MKRACVIGWPVAHSRSPLVHTYWLKRHGLEGDYTKEAVPPEEIERFLKGLGARGYVGANVTLPHKAAALAAADEVDAAARAIGAANTLWLDAEGKLHASNTDAYGFMTHLAEQAPDWNEKKRPVMVLGAGGAGRAIVHGLLEAGASKVIVANRTREHAEALAEAFGPRVVVVPWEERSAALAGCGLLVNTTSLGLTGKPPLEIDLAALPEDAVVADIVYSPLETKLLAAARARGNRCVDGLGMLIASGGAGLRALVRRRAKGDAGASRPCAASLKDAMMLVIGLTGSIGMGKTTAAALNLPAAACRSSTPMPKCIASTPARRCQPSKLPSRRRCGRGASTARCSRRRLPGRRKSSEGARGDRASDGHEG